MLGQLVEKRIGCIVEGSSRVIRVAISWNLPGIDCGWKEDSSGQDSKHVPPEQNMWHKVQIRCLMFCLNLKY